MTTHELAKKLLTMPDVMVTVRGYEGGVDEIKTVHPIGKLHLDCNKDWWDGNHEYKTDEECVLCEHKIVDAIHLEA